MTVEEIVRLDGIEHPITLSYCEEDSEFVAEIDDGPTLRFDFLKQATLLLGLWKRCGPFEFADSSEVIPLAVAKEGKPAMAAYLAMVIEDDPATQKRGEVADTLDVTRQTISNYWDEVRWDGCYACGSENVKRPPVSIEGDLPTVVDCHDCGNVDVLNEDIFGTSHEEFASEESWKRRCVDELESRTVRVADGDEYVFAYCPACGFCSAR